MDQTSMDEVSNFVSPLMIFFIKKTYNFLIII